MISTWLAAAPVLAASRVELILATEADFPATSVNEWYKLLTGLRVESLQIRPASPVDKIEITNRGTEVSPAYRVYGRLTGANQMIVPGGRFAMHDQAGIKTWLERLRTEGIERAGGAPRPLFGLPPEKLALVKADLAKPVEMTTAGEPTRAVIEKLATKVGYPLLADNEVRAALAAAGPIGDELQGVALGTAIAAILRPVGLVFVPRLTEQRRPEYLVSPARGASESWPIGWPPQQDERELLPDMVELVNIEIDDIPASQVVAAIAGRVKAPVVYDRVALARFEIDPATKHVSLPGKKSMYALALRKSLFAAGLKYELRVDEADKPLFWITSLKAP
ncbi:MAG TPA: hypothetical protein VHZ24_01375 [Pirellulales bacterium]|jgi:hypothetical protein|nr:hypothetical protein [Pirellulales bacterium]